MAIVIDSVETSRQLNAFIDLPHILYKDDPCYVPQLRIQQLSLLDFRKNPFFCHSKMKLFIAYRNGEPVGRIAAIVNNNHNKYHGDSIGFFGFFDCENIQETAETLFKNAVNYLKSQGLTSIRGPVNPDTNNSCGLLLNGFDTPPSVFMPYNSPWHKGLLLNFGFILEKKLFAWEIRGERIDKRTLASVDHIKNRLQKDGYCLRAFNMKDFNREAALLRIAYNDSLQKNWGTVPLTEKEFVDQAKSLKLICKPEYIQVVEHHGEIVAYLGAVPDLNEVLIKVKNGRIFPCGLFKILSGFKKIKNARIVMFGVKQQYRFKGLPVWLYIAMVNCLCNLGFQSCEASYVLEDNNAVNDLAKKLGGVLTKEYGIFSRRI